LSPSKLIYLGRSRLHRNRANLIQTLHMVNAFRDLGVDVTLYLPPWLRSIKPDERLQYFGIDPPLDIRQSRLLHSRWKLWPFIKFYKSHLQKADDIYTRSVKISLLLADEALPHHLEVHEAGSELVKEGYLDKVVSAHRQGLIRWLFPINRAAADVLLQAGAAPARILISPCGVKLSAFSQIKSFQPERLSMPNIVYLGLLSRDRGLSIFEELSARRVARITLVGDQEDAVAPSDYLRLVPFVPHCETPRWWEQTDLVLLPYQRSLPQVDSMSPIKLFEAMAAGRPIIASDLPAIREILEHEKTALLVEADDVEGWIVAVNRLQNEPELASRLAEAARQKAREYSWEKRAENIIKTCGWLES
jgi:glycosyltransferase involved in cell wall biosynthesis